MHGKRVVLGRLMHDIRWDGEKWFCYTLKRNSYIRELRLPRRQEWHASTRCSSSIWSTWLGQAAVRNPGICPRGRDDVVESGNVILISLSSRRRLRLLHTSCIFPVHFAIDGRLKSTVDADYCTFYIDSVYTLFHHPLSSHHSASFLSPRHLSWFSWITTNLAWEPSLALLYTLQKAAQWLSPIRFRTSLDATAEPAMFLVSWEPLAPSAHGRRL